MCYVCLSWHIFQFTPAQHISQIIISTMSQHGRHGSSRHGPGSYASRRHAQQHRSFESDMIHARNYNSELERDRHSRPRPSLNAECTASYTRYYHCGHSTETRTQSMAGCWQCALMTPYRCSPNPIRIEVNGRCSSCNADGRDVRGRFVSRDAELDRDNLSRHVSKYGKQGGSGGAGYQERPYHVG